MTKPVQVYILLGQSNMLGFGKIKPAKGKPEGSLSYAVNEAGLYPYLIDDDGNWTERKDVRNVRVMGSGNKNGRLIYNEWLTINNRNIGPEVGIGHYLGNATEAPVLIIKSCIGNRSLGWDLLQPESPAYEFAGERHGLELRRLQAVTTSLGEGKRTRTDRMVCRNAVRR